MVLLLLAFQLASTLQPSAVVRQHFSWSALQLFACGPKDLVVLAMVPKTVIVEGEY
jgi:hypothetical protein